MSANEEFKFFYNKYDITHTTSSPEYPQSNGFVEKPMQTAKRLIIKTRKDKSDLYLARLDLRNSHRDSVIGSPVQCLMGHRTRTLLSTAAALLKPEIKDPSIVQSRMMEHRANRRNTDRSARPLQPLQPGDPVRTRTRQGWQTAMVVHGDLGPRSYMVEQYDTGGLYRRNHRHIMKT